MEALKERTGARLTHISPSMGSAILPVFYDAPITSAEEERIDYVQHATSSLADRLYNGVRYSALSGLGAAVLLMASKTVEAWIEDKPLSEQRFDVSVYAMGVGYLAACALMIAGKTTEYFSRKKNGTEQP